MSHSDRGRACIGVSQKTSDCNKMKHHPEILVRRYTPSRKVPV